MTDQENLLYQNIDQLLWVMLDYKRGTTDS